MKFYEFRLPELTGSDHQKAIDGFNTLCDLPDDAHIHWDMDFTTRVFVYRAFVPDEGEKLKSHGIMDCMLWKEFKKLKQRG